MIWLAAKKLVQCDEASYLGQEVLHSLDQFCNSVPHEYTIDFFICRWRWHGTFNNQRRCSFNSLALRYHLENKSASSGLPETKGFLLKT